MKPWYRQFYLRRGDASWASDQVSDEGYAAGVEAIGGFVYVGTTMYGSPTAVAVEVTETAPAAPPEAERSVVVEIGGKGRLGVLGWGDNDPTAVADVPVGPLGCRVSWMGSEEAAEHPDAEIGGQALSPETIVIQIWPTL